MGPAQRKVDVSTLLMSANLLILGLIVLEAFRLRDNPYVDQLTLLLGSLLCVQTILALVFERLQRDPFVMLFAFSMTFFYGLRILTLSWFGFSDVFPRYPYSSEDTNFALFYMLIANLFMYAGLFGVRGRGVLGVSAEGWEATSPHRVLIVLVAAIAFSYLGGALWSGGGMPRAINFIVLLLSPGMLTMLVLAYFILFRKTLGYVTATAILLLIFAEVVAHTLAGSRSAILGLVQTSFLVMLAIWGRIQLSRWLVAWGFAAAPVLLALMVATFAISTYNRFAAEAGEAPDLERAAEFVSASANDPLIVARLGIIAPAIASRAGFFDYSAEIIAHREHYAPLFTAGTYFRSIVDNVLTPGLDLYDQPKIANSLQFVHQSWGTPSKIYVAESYQSDQIGIYGEFFVLFGWGSLPLLFMVTFILKSIYVRLSSPNPYVFAMQRIIVLYIFVRTLDSFGMDWTITETVPLVLAILLYAKFFTSRRIASREPGPHSHAVAG